MNQLFRFAVIPILLLSGCTEDIQVFTDDTSPKPVIYALIDPVDTVHFIRVERVFNASSPPLETARVTDSVYFSEQQVVVRLIKSNGDSTVIFPDMVTDSDKEAGIFTGEGHRYYRFSEQLDWWKFPLYQTIEVEVRVPGLLPAIGKSDFLPRAHVRWPYVAQQYLFIDEERPILVQWHGDAWNEMDVTFDIIEQYADSTACQQLKFSKTTDIIMVAGVCEVKIPYELLVQDMVRHLTVKRDLVRRYFGNINILIHTGNRDFRHYMDTQNGINDFNGGSGTNVDNGFGFVACKWTTVVDSLRFDYFSRTKLADEPRLKNFGFIEW